MLHHFLIICGTVIGLSPFSFAQVSLDMEPKEANSTITDVTLYRNRAAVTRTATFDLQTGGYTFYFRNLPGSVFLESVQASTSEGASLLSVETSNTPVVKNVSALLKEINEQIEDVESKLIIVNARTEALKYQVNLLNTLITQAGNEKSSTSVDLEVLEQQLKFIGTKMATLTENQATNRKEKERLEEELKTLKRKKQNIGSNQSTQLDAIVDIGVTKPGSVEIELTYLVANATWQPRYSIRASNSGDEITVEYDAEIWQRTGENWTDVSMILSTAQPQQSTTPPMPTPWFVDVYTPPPPTAGRGRSSKTMSMPDINVSEGGELGMAWATDSIAGVELVEMAQKHATVNNDGPAVSFNLPRSITVPSNVADKQTTSLGAFESEAELFHIAVPMMTDRTFIRSNVTNTSEYILLPGQASIFHGSDYVGKTALPTITPNEIFPLDLGIDPAVTATRVLLEKETASTGLFASGKQTLYEYRISISNGHDEPIELQVWDRFPVSRNEDIEITLDTLSAPLSSDPTYVTSQQPLGLLRWDLTIPANMTGDNQFTITWQVEIARGKDVEMTPLPE